MNFAHGSIVGTCASLHIRFIIEEYAYIAHIARVAGWQSSAKHVIKMNKLYNIKQLQQLGMARNFFVSKIECSYVSNH